MSRTDELEAFKTGINLAEYAAHCGYILCPDKTSTGSAVMENDATGDKIIVALDTDGHGNYFSVRDDDSNGSIIDLDQAVHGGTLGDVRKRLRAFAGRPSAAFARAAAIPKLRPVSKNLFIEGYVGSNQALPKEADFAQMTRVALESARVNFAACSEEHNWYEHFELLMRHPVINAGIEIAAWHHYRLPADLFST